MLGDGEVLFDEGLCGGDIACLPGEISQNVRLSGLEDAVYAVDRLLGDNTQSACLW